MIHREDMLELTRRMTPARTSMTRVAGCYIDRYDIPAKASDKERLGESEEVFEYLICVVCPLSGEYEPGKPECGFLFPAFTDRCGDLNHVNVYQKNPARPHMELIREILGAE